MLSKYGLNTLVILFLVYWSQGFKSLSYIATTLYFKETLHLDPGLAQLLRTFSALAWAFKPLCGLISDKYPLLGYRRKSYLFLLGLIGTVSMLSMLLHTDIFLSVLALTLNEFCQAFSDVIADAIMVEKSRLDINGSSTLQSFSWFALTLGGTFGSLLGGVLLERFSPRLVIATTAICPLLILLTAVGVQEGNSAESSANFQLESLKNAIKLPKVFKPLLFIVILVATAPRYSELTIYYLKDHLQFSSSFLSRLGMVAFIGFMFGSLLYGFCLKSTEYYQIISVGQLLMIIINFMDLALVLNVYGYIGLPAWAFVLGDEVLGSVVAFTCRMMPFFVMSAKLCPVGIEATFYSLFAAVLNLSYSFSGIFGALLVHIMGVRTGAYELFWVLIVIQISLKVVPFGFLRLIPLKDEIQEVRSEIELLEEDQVKPDRYFEKIEDFNNE